VAWTALPPSFFRKKKPIAIHASHATYSLVRRQLLERQNIGAVAPGAGDRGGMALP
jgi:hypothetical protein